MSKRVDLLNGNILKALISMAVPIMATSLLEMAYNMTDMIWIGRMGSDSVAAVGAAGMFTQLAMGLCALSKVGGQVKVAQSYGAGDKQEACRYASTALQLGIVMAITYSILLLFNHKSFIGFFNLTNPVVISQAETYLSIVGCFIVFNFVNPICTALITATGNSKTPFMVSSVGLVTNIVLDPILIFGWLGMPKLGVAGAAIATVIAQGVVCTLYILYLRKDYALFHALDIRVLPKGVHLKNIVRIGLPASLQGIMFTGIAMVVGRIIAMWGETAIAVQKVGVQVESISYMAADGFSAATNSFIAQNYGAKNIQRTQRGVRTAFMAMLVWGSFTSIVLIFIPAPIFRVFLPQADILPLGVDYLRILGYSQLAMCLEILCASCFAAFGRSLPPSIVAVLSTIARIPVALFLGQTALGLNGVWWSITLCTILHATVLLGMFYFFMQGLDKKFALQSQSVQS